MTQPLTISQADFITGMDSAYAAFKAALQAALEADNDPTVTVLDEATTLRRTLNDAHESFSKYLAFGYTVPTNYMQHQGVALRRGAPPFDNITPRSPNSQLPRQ